ncbi:LIM/homeobox protein Lhx8 [Homalodisca vitripennis]|nr:LIM/homeobox protein Lhx8 [Homalodisca vitripennis]
MELRGAGRGHGGQPRRGGESATICPATRLVQTMKTHEIRLQCSIITSRPTKHMFQSAIYLRLQVSLDKYRPAAPPDCSHLNDGHNLARAPLSCPLDTPRVFIGSIRFRKYSTYTGERQRQVKELSERVESGGCGGDRVIDQSPDRPRQFSHPEHDFSVIYDPESVFQSNPSSLHLSCSSRLILLQTEQRMCAACSEPITDKYLLQVSGRSWHAHCLRCCVCQLALDRQPSCFIKDDSIYCKADYAKSASHSESGRGGSGLSTVYLGKHRGPAATKAPPRQIEKVKLAQNSGKYRGYSVVRAQPVLPGVQVSAASWPRTVVNIGVITSSERNLCYPAFKSPPPGRSRIVKLAQNCGKYRGYNVVRAQPVLPGVQVTVVKLAQNCGKYRGYNVVRAQPVLPSVQVSVVRSRLVSQFLGHSVGVRESIYHTPLTPSFVPGFPGRPIYSRRASNSLPLHRCMELEAGRSTGTDTHYPPITDSRVIFSPFYFPLKPSRRPINLERPESYLSLRGFYKYE